MTENEMIKHPDMPDRLLAGNRWLPREASRLLYDEGWRDWNLIVGLGVMRAESALYDGAVGGPNPDGSMDFGLMQINSNHYQRFGFINIEAFKNACMTPVDNVKFAHEIYVDASYTFKPWAAYTVNGKSGQPPYLDFIRLAILGVANMWAVKQKVELLYG